ncbi:MAG: ABC1 kinase family protein [Actinomycetota bacterium]
MARASQIATILWASEFRWLVDALGLQACVSLQCRVSCAVLHRPCPHHVAMDRPLPDRMRTVLERLGPTFVKGGQLLALRLDHLPPEYAEALRGLYDHVPPFGAMEAERVLVADLGRPLAQAYAEFEAEPFAAASLSQVHRARLPDGTPVAVKIQRPGVADQVESDLALLKFLAGQLERRSARARAYRPAAAVAEVADWTRRELDFRREARTADNLRRMFGDDPEVVVPRVHWQLTTRRVLTMDLVQGERPAPAAELSRQGLDPHRVLEVGSRAMFRQIFEFGLFHADPHPGNLLLLPGDRVAFLDFGMFGRIGRRERRRMALVLWALVDGTYDAVGDQLLHLSVRRPGADIRGFREAISEMVEEWYGRPAREYSIARLLLHELGAGAAYGVIFPRELMLLARAMVTLESTAALIDPQVRLADLVEPVIPDLRRLLLPSADQLRRGWEETRYDWLALALEIPETLPHLVGNPDAVPAPVAPSPGRVRWLGWAGLAAAGLAGAAAARVLGPRPR